MDANASKKLIVKYISNKSGLDYVIIDAAFKKVIGDAKKLSRDGLLGLFNALVMPKTKTESSGAKSETKTESESAELSYKTKYLIESGFLPQGPDLYVDHGCGSGVISSEIAEACNAKSTKGIDIYVHPLAQFPVVIPERDGSLPLASDSCDLVTCLLSLHHVPDQDRAVSELCRMTRGSIIIYEHDVSDSDKYFRLFLDAVHLTFEFFGTDTNEALLTAERVPKKMSMSEVSWIFSGTKYHTRGEWSNLFTKHGYKSVGFFMKKNSQNMYFEKFIRSG